MRPFLIGIAGASCSGKTELAGRLAQILDAVICPLDSYYRDLAHLPLEQRAQQNFDVPEALDRALLCEQVSALARGERIRKPVYDFSRHVRADHSDLLEPAKVVIVEGLFTLYWDPLRTLLNLKVFVEASESICLERRIKRDVQERGRTPESVREQFDAAVRPMAQLHVRPTQAFADLVVNGEHSPDDACAAVLTAMKVT